MDYIYSKNPAMFRNNPIGFILCILLIPAFGIGLLILLIWYLRTKAARLVVSNNEIMYEEGLLNKDRTELNIDRVRSVKVSQTLFNRIFGTGKVLIYTAGDNPEIATMGMPEPHKIREIIKQINPAN